MSSSRAPVWVCVDQLSIAQVMSKRVGVRPPVEGRGGGEVTHTLENEFFPPFFLFPPFLFHGPCFLPQWTRRHVSCGSCFVGVSRAKQETHAIMPFALIAPFCAKMLLLCDIKAQSCTFAESLSYSIHSHSRIRLQIWNLDPGLGFHSNLAIVEWQ